MSDGLRLILAFLILVAAPAAIWGLWWWFWTWIAIAVVLAIAEIAAKLSTGRTLSQQFWAWSKTRPALRWIILSGIAVFFTYLILHLGFGI